MAGILLVSYPATEGARFDRDYYTGTHMPLVKEKWGPLGLTDAVALFPDDDAPAAVAVAVLTFTDGAARDAAMSAPVAAEVFGDVPNFTTISPAAQRLTG
jgi:uncharacterized protein (TIGR02118 family)